MSSDKALSNQVASVLGVLRILPGCTGISIQTRRYPHFLPAEDGRGFEQQDWSFEGDVELGEVSIPADTEDVFVTWMGIPASKLEIEAAVRAVVTDLSSMGTHWDFRLFTRRQGADERRLVVQVFPCFGSSSC